MYHWIAAVAPKRMSAFLSFFTGWFTVCGCELPREFPVALCRRLIFPRDLYDGLDELDLRPDIRRVDSPVPSGLGNPDLADIRHLSGPQSNHSQRRPLWQQNHPLVEQIFPVLPSDWLVCSAGNCHCLRPHPSEFGIRLQNVDQQHRLGKQRNLLHHRIGQPAV